MKRLKKMRKQSSSSS